MISLIAAIGKNNELGKNNSLLWHIPADMKHFRNITITPDANYKQKNLTTHAGVEIVHSLSEAFDLFPDKNEEIFIIGGGELYKQSMEIADKLYITHIDAEDKEADSFFPEIIPMVWNEISHTEHKADEKNLFDYTFSVYEKF